MIELGGYSLSGLAFALAFSCPYASSACSPQISSRWPGSESHFTPWRCGRIAIRRFSIWLSVHI